MTSYLVCCESRRVSSMSRRRAMRMVVEWSHDRPDEQVRPGVDARVDRQVPRDERAHRPDDLPPHVAVAGGRQNRLRHELAAAGTARGDAVPGTREAGDDRLAGSGAVVADAAVVGLADPEWGQCVTATIEPRPDRRDVESIEQHCRAQLAGYKVPRRFDFVDAMPRNEVGKVSRRNLRDARAADATNA
jgi:hypothetical protein